MARFYLLLILFVIAIIDVYKISAEYEFFRLVEFWGPSYCRVYPCRRKPPVPKFTLHGLWPDNYTDGLYNCGGSSYIPLQDQQSINKRDDYWYDYFSRNPPSARKWPTQQKFWAIEWRNHGTCSENVFNQPAYFNLAETLMFTHNLTSILFDPKMQQIQVPYPWPRVSDIMSAISKYTGVRPELRCRSYYHGKMLVEVVLCYDDKGKQVINCPPPGFIFCGRRTSRIYVPRMFKK